MIRYISERPVFIFLFSILLGMVIFNAKPQRGQHDLTEWEKESKIISRKLSGKVKNIQFRSSDSLKEWYPFVRYSLSPKVYLTLQTCDTILSFGIEAPATHTVFYQTTFLHKSIFISSSKKHFE